MDINKVLVIGAGTMGSQITLLCARAGYAVTCYDLHRAAIERARTQLLERSRRDVAKGRASADNEAQAWSRVRFATSLDGLGTDTDLAIEAAVEDLELKRKILAELDRALPPHALIASNSSSFMPSQLADASGRPALYCNIHFFNPALVMKCVEIVGDRRTSATTIEAARNFALSLDKTPAVLDKEIPGFVANRILNAVRDEAIHLLEGGIASVEAIDTVCRTALGYPMGPFELMDLTGIDIGYLSKKARFEQTGATQDAPSVSVSALVARGDLGRKSGRGWYEYDKTGRRLGPTELS